MLLEYDSTVHRTIRVRIRDVERAGYGTVMEDLT